MSRRRRLSPQGASKSSASDSGSSLLLTIEKKDGKGKRKHQKGDAKNRSWYKPAERLLLPRAEESRQD